MIKRNFRFSKVNFEVRKIARFSILSLILLFADGSFAPGINSVSDTWQTSLHDNTRTSASSDTTLTKNNINTVVKRWSFQTGGPIAASPTVVGGMVYVGSWDGYEYALDASTGAFKWKVFLGITTADPICIPPQLGISSAATVRNNTVYVGGGDSYWYALNASNGQVLWKVFTGDNSAASSHYNWSSPLIYNGYAYIGIASVGDCPLVQGQLLKVNLTTHLIEKTLNIVPDGQVGGGIWTSPSLDVATNRIFVATGTENRADQTYAQGLVAVDATSLQIVDFWKLPEADAVLDSDFGTSATLFTSSTGTSLVASINKNGYAYAFNRNNLSAGPLWRQAVAVGGQCPTCGQSSVSSGSFSGGKLFMGGGFAVIGNQGYPGSVNAFNPDNGSYLWQHGTTGTVIAALSSVNGMVVSASGSIFEILDNTNGNRLYSYNTGSDMYSAPSIANGFIFTGNLNGTIFAFGLPAVTPPPPPPDVNCPSGWLCQDIGTTSSLGSELVSSGTWTVKASGNGIKGGSDGFRLMSKNTNGNVQVNAQLTSLQNTVAGSQAGLILRQNNDPISPYYAVFITPNNNLAVQSRSAFGGDSSIINTANLGSLPKYLEIQRVGDTFQAATSVDGVNYTLVPGTTVTLALPYQLLAGLAVSSGQNGQILTAVLKNIAIGIPSNTPQPNPSAHSCPSGWNCNDIGNPIITGDQTLSSGVWTVKGAGGDIWDTSDQFHFVWQSKSGDLSLNAHVTAQTNSDPFAKAGLMLRGGTNARAAYYAAYLTPGNGIQVQYRDTQGLVSGQVASIAGATPAYLQIARSGGTFTAYTSSDGSNWLPLSGSSITLNNLSGTLLAGLVINSHNTAILGSATIGNVNFINSAPLPPNICPNSWTCNDIGFPTPRGDQVLSNGSWTIQAGGGDIWDNSDQFRYIYQTQAVDRSLSGHLISQSNTSDWAKAGLMYRLSNDPAAPYYGVFNTLSNGLVVQYRSSQAGFSSQVSTIGTVPIYLKISHSATSFSAYTSNDGTSWNLIPGSTITLSNLTGSLLTGMAVTSHNPSAATTALFENVLFGPPTPPSNVCPTGYTCGDIGGPALVGSTDFNNNSFTMYGGGNDIWGTTDQFQYASQSLIGDGEIITRVTSQTNTDPWAKAGVMIKESRTALAPYVWFGVTPGNGLHLQYNFNGDQSAGTYSFPDVWLKLRRVGNTFTAFSSNDGTNWTQVGVVSVTMASGATGGLFVNSHGGAFLSKVTFDNVSLANLDTSLPSPWVNTDLGSPALLGSASYSNGVFTNHGSGNDIWGSSDQFNYTYQTISGDATIIARLTSQTNTSDWAKAGVMIKGSATALASYVLFGTTPGNGTVLQYNFNGSQSTGIYTYPTWLKLKRIGDTFTAYSSTNGTDWTQVGATTLTINNSATIGLFVTSHDGTQLSTVTFDNVSASQP